VLYPFLILQGQSLPNSVISGSITDEYGWQINGLPRGTVAEWGFPESGTAYEKLMAYFTENFGHAEVIMDNSS
jgi:hypothetical protein